MDTKKTEKSRIRIKKLAAVVLAMIVAAGICFTLPGSGAFAAGGSVTVSVPNIDGLDTADPAFTGFTFKIYEVGTYNGASAVLKDEYAGLGVNVNIADKKTYDESKSEDDPAWEEAWLKQAAALANHITHPAANADGTAGTAPAADATYENVMPGTSFRFSSNNNSLYLVIGQTARAGAYNWTPVPVFVKTLSADETFSFASESAVKIERELVVYEHGLAKIWDDNNDSAKIRPDSVKAGIYYGESLIDTVTLGGEGEDAKWTYEWTSEETGDTYKYIPGSDYTAMSAGGTKEFTPDAESKWDVREFTESEDGEATALRYYTPEYSKADSGDEDAGEEAAQTGAKETFYITNTLASKSIEIEKLVDGYVDDGHNVTLSFRIDGYKADDEGNAAGDPVWTTHAGIAFGKNDGEVKDGKISNTVVIDYVPADVQVIKVTEEYSGNYKPDGEPQITQEGSSWKVVMNNTHDDHRHGGGVVNRYVNGGEAKQIGLD